MADCRLGPYDHITGALISVHCLRVPNVLSTDSCVDVQRPLRYSTSTPRTIRQRCFLDRPRIWNELPDDFMSV